MKNLPLNFIVSTINKLQTIFQFKNVLTKCIDPIFEEQMYREAIKETFEENSYIMCEAFFRSNLVEDLSDEVFSNNIQWKTKGPLNKR